jgi:Zn-dependent protease with chaperone function
VTRTLRALMMVAAVLAVIVPAEAQRPTSNQSNDAKLRERERARAEQNARRYEKLKTFALGLYQNDLEFREEVDGHFDEVQRDHSIQAFQKNVAPPARPTVVHDGDRLRLQTGLYDNKLVADYINRVGQRLVPVESDRLFAFRLVAHPIPFAETLSTGTIYISTGLVSLLDNEAQLAYVLAHEMAHVQLDHWKLKSTLYLAQEEFAQKEGRKRTLIGAVIGAAVGATAGGLAGNSATAVQAGVTAAALGAVIGAAWNSALSLDWDTVQENEADSVAFKTVLNRSYDVREIRTLYAALQSAVRQDQRVGLAFMGNKRRTAERIANVEDLITTTFKGEIDSKQGRFVVTDPEFIRVMAALKRDNGIMSFYHDMFQLARTNLEYARKYRPNDPSAHYYYGKVLKLVGRTDEDRKAADDAFQRAIDFDHRERNYGAHFYRALALINQKNASLNPEIAKELQSYLMASIRFASEEAAHANALPANLDDMYDYLTEAGDVTWRPVVPDSIKGAMTNAGTQNQKTESPLKTPTVSKPVVPVKK